MSSFVASASNIDYIFKRCDNVQEITFGSGFNTTGVTSMKELFSNLTNLQTLTIPFRPIAFDTSNVIDMSEMFYWCYNIASISLVNFNTSNVTDMSEMFESCDKLDSIVFGDDFDTSSVINMFGMFYGCSLSDGLDLSAFDTSKVENMNYMFKESGIETLDISTFNFVNLKEARDMFKNCTALTTIYASTSNPIKVRKAVYPALYYDDMFDGCTNLVGGNGTVYNSSNPTDGTYACVDGEPSSDVKGYFTMKYDEPNTDYKLKAGFYDYASLSEYSIKKIVVKYGVLDYHDYNGDFYEKYIISESNGLICVTGRGGESDKVAFIYAPYLDCEEYSNLKILTECKNLFNGFYNITSVDNIANLSVTYCHDFSNMFKDCHYIEEIDLSSFDPINASDVTGMFDLCRRVKKITIGDKFKASNILSTEAMFNECNKLNVLNVKFGNGYINTSKVTSMKKMFNGCGSLKTIDLKKLNTAKVATMAYMFANCKSLKTIDINGFKMDNLVDMSGMFMNCISIKELDIEKVKTENVSKMANMFKGCSNLITILIDKNNFVVDKVLNKGAYVGGDGDEGVDMFLGCVKIKDAAGTTYDALNVNAEYAQIVRISTLKGYFVGQQECVYNGTKYYYLETAIKQAQKNGGTIKMIMDKEISYPIVLLGNNATDGIAKKDYVIDGNNKTFVVKDLNVDPLATYYTFAAFGNKKVTLKNLVIKDEGNYRNNSCEFFVTNGNLTLKNIKCLSASNKENFIYKQPLEQNSVTTITLDGCNIITDKTLIAQANYKSEPPVVNINSGYYKAKKMVALDSMESDAGILNIKTGTFEFNNPITDDFISFRDGNVSKIKYEVNVKDIIMLSSCRYFFNLNKKSEGILNISGGDIECNSALVYAGNNSTMKTNISKTSIESSKNMFESDNSNLDVIINSGTFNVNKNVFACKKGKIDVNINGGDFTKYALLLSERNVDKAFVLKGGRYKGNKNISECYSELLKYITYYYRAVDIEQDSAKKFYYEIVEKPTGGGGGGGGGARNSVPLVNQTIAMSGMSAPALKDQVFTTNDNMEWIKGVFAGEWRA